MRSSFGTDGVWRLLFLALILLAPPDLSRAGNAEAPPPPAPRAGPEMKTLKEKLSDKASDEQRVDNCHVPPERRGAKARPDCAPSLSAPFAKSD
jgi:hypothetical protein